MTPELGERGQERADGEVEERREQLAAEFPRFAPLLLVSFFPVRGLFLRCQSLFSPMRYF